MENISCAHNDRPLFNIKIRWILTVIVIISCSFIFKGFIIRQLLNRAISYYGFGMYNDAIREYQKVLLMEHDNEEALNWMGYSYKVSGRYPEAIKVYKEAISFNPKNYFAYLDLGLIYLDEGKIRKAKDTFYQVSLIDTQNIGVNEGDLSFNYKMCLHWLAKLQSETDEANEAIGTYKLILKYDPDDKRAKTRLKE